jgi:hypothetical protein
VAGKRQRTPDRRIRVGGCVLVAEVREHDDRAADDREPRKYEGPLEEMPIGPAIDERQQKQDADDQSRESPSSPAARADRGSTSAVGTDSGSTTQAAARSSHPTDRQSGRAAS